jgi:hypothetical protein
MLTSANGVAVAYPVNYFAALCKKAAEIVLIGVRRCRTMRQNGGDAWDPPETQTKALREDSRDK